MYFLKKEEDKKSLIDDFQNIFMDSIFTNKHLKTNIIDNESEYILKIEIPGVKKNEIELNYIDHYLNVFVDKKESFDQSNDNYIRKEINLTSYSRSFYLNNGDEDNINAKLEDGILTINVKKLKNIEKNKKIEVE